MGLYGFRGERDKWCVDKLPGLHPLLLINAILWGGCNEAECLLYSHDIIWSKIIGQIPNIQFLINTCKVIYLLAVLYHPVLSIMLFLGDSFQLSSLNEQFVLVLKKSKYSYMYKLHIVLHT